MKLYDDMTLVSLLRSGGVAVVRTDTVYGLVASADIETAVERVYQIKGRDANKSCIVLLDSMSSAYGHAADLVDDTYRDYQDIPTSFLLRGHGAPNWLLRENDELAYRIPKSRDLQMLLAKTGPLIAPSANPQGLTPAMNISEAKAYFGDQVDLYIDGGQVPLDTLPSRLLRIHENGEVEQLR
jgi:L-threonylcarbamoyladenylate synthase